MFKLKNILVLISLAVIAICYQNCTELESSSVNSISSLGCTTNSLSEKTKNKLSTQSWFMEEVLENGNFSLLNSNPQIKTSHWMHDSINGAHISVNGWALGAKLIKDANILWEIEDQSGELALEWFMGGYNRDYNGIPQHGWYYNNQRGGNDVKAYPRIAIGSASGQPNASWGAPNTPSKSTNGIKHVDHEQIKRNVGIPSRYKDTPKIDLNVDLRFSGGSDAVPAKDKYGNFFFAVDSYFHDIDTPEMQLDPSLAGTLSGINDSSGNIYGKKMENRAESSKRWAMMIWYGKSAYYETSGGKKLADKVMIGGVPHTVKYKLEKASHHTFHYASFIMDRDVERFYKSTLQPTITFNNYADFLTDGRYQAILDAYMDKEGDLIDLDGVKRRIKAPTKDYVLTDVNLGVEILSNPDTPQDTSPKPVRINFKRLSFSVEGKGEFGHKGDPNNRTPASQIDPIVADPADSTPGDSTPPDSIDVFPKGDCSKVKIEGKYNVDGQLRTVAKIVYDNIDWPYVEFDEGGGKSCDNRNRDDKPEVEDPDAEKPVVEVPGDNPSVGNRDVQSVGPCPN